MAEDTLADKRAYDPTRDASDARPRGMTRRKFLNAAVVTTGLAIGGIIGETLTQPQPEKTSYELLFEKLQEKGIKTSDMQIHLGEMKIIKGTPKSMLNVRSAPNLTNSEITEWLNIVSWNGKDISSVNEFTNSNFLFVEGENPDDPTGTKGKKGLWGVALVGTNTLGIKKKDIRFISYSSSTGSLVVPISGEFHTLTESSKDGVVIDKGQKIPANKLGVITPGKTR